MQPITRVKGNFDAMVIIFKALPRGCNSKGQVSGSGRADTEKDSEDDMNGSQ